MRKKIWAWIMTVMMVISMMPTSVFAGTNDTTKQTDNGQKAAVEQTNAGQIGNYFKVNVSEDKDQKNVGTLENSPTLKANAWADTQKTYEDDNKVKVNKTIEATGEENVFDITLTVSTSEKIEKVESNVDAAVVLVIDCSGSMEGNRLRTAKNAAQTFINGFVAKKADGTVDTSVKRKIAIVRYSGSKKTAGYDGANTVVNWTDASNLKTNNNNQLCNAIDNLSAGGATNTEAGLMLGRNLLNKGAENGGALDGISNKNIILLTDGAPTLGVTDSAEDKYKNALETICPKDRSGYSIDSVGEGDETTCDTHKDAETIAKNLTKSGYDTYAIYVGDQWVDCETPRCNLYKSGADWLANDCGFKTFSATDDKIAELINIFEKILELIEQKAQAWILTDPMGTNIEFVEFKSEENPVNEFTQKDGTITWDLKNSARGNKSTETGYTTYELKYRVKLDTLADGYSAGTYYATNGVTGVTYSITETNDTGETSYTFDTAYFNVPSVKGYDADLTFDKVGSFGEALSGAEFTLTHACGDSCKDTQVTNASWAKATSDSNGEVSFANIPSGHKYTLKETKAPGTNGQYTKSNETYTVTVAYGDLTITDKDGNTVDASALQVVNESDTIDIKGTKTWNDNNDQDGKRPESITVELYADGQKVTETDGETAVTAVANATNGWKWSFKNLPKYKGGNEITYTIKEVNVPTGYEASNNGVGNADNNYTITNSHTPETVNIEGTKTWNDNNNQDGKRPESITVKLLADDEDAVDKDGKAITATVTADDDWAYSFNNLPKYENGNEITYTVVEATVPDGYEADVDGYNITNTHTPEKVNIPVSKTWNDADNQDGVRPGSIKVTLYEGNNATDKTLTLNADNNWSGSFTGLDKYKDGSEIEYTVKEEAVTGYEVKVTGSIANGFIITNTHTPETTSISGTKTWDDDGDRDGKRPESITVNLLADGQPAVNEDGEAITATVRANNNWTYSFNNLPKKAAGKEIIYKVTENAVENYSTTYDGNNIKNSYTPAKTSITVTKSWDDADNQDGIRPASITVKLYAKSSADPIGSLVLNEANNWQGTFTDLNVNSIVSGVSRPIEYYVVEEIPEGYEVAITGDSSTGYTITNTHTPEIISVDGTKSWDDNDNRDGKRPEKITVNLFADGKAAVDKDGKAITTTVTADDDWAYSFNNLPKFKDGKAIEYTVTEEAVAGYESTVNGYNITNTHTPETVDISGTKTWNDNNDQDGVRPESITVNLLADGQPAVDKDGKAITTTVKADSDGNWAWSFDNLPKYKDGEVGQKIAYTVTEEAVTGYTSDVKGNAEKGFTITNTREVEKTSINVAKVWADDDNRDNIRPNEITVKLLANGRDTGKTVKLNKENEWKASFTDLDKNSGGKAIEYAVDELGLPEGYDSLITGNATVGYTITNSHTPAFVSISGTKTWNDGDNQDGIRPENITVRLLADGIEVNSQTVAGTDNTWSYTFSTDKDGENLPKYNKGKEIEYTVSEDAVDGYTVSVNGYDITNTHTPSVTSISGSKTWNDNGDQDGVRPESITVRLHADGKEIDSRTVTAASGWSWSFTNLPVKKAGVAINYTITEDAVKDYTPAINGANITNTHTPDKTSVAVSKAWNDDNNRDGKRASIDVVLYANGTSTGKTITLSEKNGWTGTFTGLDKNSNGEAINYTVKEANVPEGYSSSITGDADKGYTITNTYSPEKTSVSGSKTWNDDNNRDGKRPEKITVRLFANDKQIDQKTIGENDGWAWSFDDLYKYENGKEISYTITEDEVAEYATEINGYDITNTYDDFETTEITVNKTWKGDSERERPDAITVKLLADGKVVETVDLTAKDGWTHTFTDLPKYASGKAGTLVVYSVEEEAVEGYTPEIAGFEITNVKNPPADEDTPNPPADPEKPGKSDNGDKAAKTGDDMNIFALAGTAFAALIGAFAAFFRRKKKA